MFLDGKKPQIDYPCRWQYKVIGQSEDGLRAAVAQAAAAEPYELSASNLSSGGKYRSMLLELTVRDEEHRLAVFKALRAHRHVIMVL